MLLSLFDFDAVSSVIAVIESYLSWWLLDVKLVVVASNVGFLNNCFERMDCASVNVSPKLGNLKSVGKK